MKIAVSIAIMAVVTYIIRAVPLCFFNKEIKSERIKSFLYYMPYAVLGAMTFPAIFYSTDSILSASAGFAAAFIMAFFNAGLLPAAGAAAVSAFIVSLII